MKTSVLLVLLLCLCEGSVQEIDRNPQRQDDGQGNANPSSELMELKDMVIKQSLEMQMLKEELSWTKIELQQRKSEYETLKAEVLQLRSDKATELQNQRTEKQTSEQLEDALTSHITAFESRMIHMEKILESSARQTRVAFSVGLTESGNVGPFTGQRTLVFNKVFFNMGVAYDGASGIFKAPVKGVYFFTFTGYNSERQGKPGALMLYHNSSMLRYPMSKGHQDMYFSNAVTRQMEAGDSVYVQLPAGSTLYDDYGHRCTLTGFLLYAL